ncbi:hypothetical protein MTR67_001804 [Solanum verrucosum]|uniref:Uncharacterized protein n=1 Tax=Solanum verrucosum TaxID=315347 RepID=A0AAF0PUZ2_SOLVR|nr:hypothetical protein MTR67_001804 [Solanum verrucosum]
MQNYGHERLNSRTFEYNLKSIRNSTPKNLELKDTIPLKGTQFMEFMQNYRHEQLDPRMSIIM